MKRIPLTEATATQLADFATANLGLDVNLRMGGDKIRAVMATAGYAKDYIEVDEPEPAVVRPVAVEAPRKMVTIRIPHQQGGGGKDAVPVGVNGRVFLIQRNMDVEVPIEVLEVLKNANTLQYGRGPNGEPINPMEVPKHPFSVVKGLAA